MWTCQNVIKCQGTLKVPSTREIFDSMRWVLHWKSLWQAFIFWHSRSLESSVLRTVFKSMEASIGGWGQAFFYTSFFSAYQLLKLFFHTRNNHEKSLSFYKLPPFLKCFFLNISPCNQRLLYACRYHLFACDISLSLLGNPQGWY
jgi:hypothetical protein